MVEPVERLKHPYKSCGKRLPDIQASGKVKQPTSQIRIDPWKRTGRMLIAQQRSSINDPGKVDSILSGYLATKDERYA